MTDFDLLRAQPGCLSLDEGMALQKMPADMDCPGAQRLEVHSLIVVRQGGLRIDIGGREYRAQADTFLDILHEFPHAVVASAPRTDAFLHLEGSGQGETDDRKRQIMKQFVELLRLHIREQRTATFYADSLCITPQYLNRVVKHMSGETTNDWICRVLAGEIRKQLQETNNSVQQVADLFHFPDQSSLTKFFKRQTGMTPSEYKKDKQKNR